ncbi:MAG: ankyrin repeat domain-containing protein [Verrucomicrobia subdivision 3 bacterium]|nr:ankyrin repeat domain-containing protein [Limisphaerales bacterium]
MSKTDTFDAFHELIKKGDIIAIRDLVESGMDVNIRNRFEWTPLMVAANEGHGPIVEYLISKGADVAAVNKFGASALAYAALRGECRAIQMLLDAGAPIDVQPHGVSLLEFAGWGDGRFVTDRHFALLRSAGAV